MANLSFNCPHCGKALDAPENVAGESFHCPLCRGLIQLLLSEGEPAATPQPHAPHPHGLSPPSSAHAPRRLVVRMPTTYAARPSASASDRCAHCGAAIASGASKCGVCGRAVGPAHPPPRSIGGIGRLSYFISVAGITALCGFALAAGRGSLATAVGAMAASLVVPLVFTVLRLNNVGVSGWWSLLALVPGLNLLITGACLVLPTAYRYHRRLDLFGKVTIGLLALGAGALAGAWPLLKTMAAGLGEGVRAASVVPLSAGGSPFEVFGWCAGDAIASRPEPYRLSDEDRGQGYLLVAVEARMGVNLFGSSTADYGPTEASVSDFRLLSAEGVTSTATAVHLLLGAPDEARTLERLARLPLRSGCIVLSRSADSAGDDDRPVWCRALFRSRISSPGNGGLWLLFRDRGSTPLPAERRRKP